MIKVFEGSITFKVSKEHPDIKHIKNPNDILKFEDTYAMKDEHFNSEEEMINYIKNDLTLVAGGGYSKEHIYDVVLDIKRIK